MDWNWFGEFMSGKIERERGKTIPNGPKMFQV